MPEIKVSITLSTGKPPHKPATIAEIIIASNTLILHTQSTHNKITDTTTGLNITDITNLWYHKTVKKGRKYEFLFTKSNEKF